MKAKLLDSDSAKVVLFGGRGYVGSAFKEALSKRGVDYFAPESAMVNLLHVQSVEAILEAMKPSFVINCAGFTGKPNVDACEEQRHETTAGNVNAVFNLSQICEKLKIPWGHVSSGCIYNGYEKDFTEEDDPNFCFTSPSCSFYSGTKAEAEKILKDMDCYVWRLRIPFDEFDSPRNYLSKVLNYNILLNVKNSISHRAEFVDACLSLWEIAAPFGTYNVTNTGSVKAEDVLNLFEKHQSYDFNNKLLMPNINEFYDIAGCKTPRSNCVLDNSKLLGAGVKMKTAIESVEESIIKWKK